MQSPAAPIFNEVLFSVFRVCNTKGKIKDFFSLPLLGVHLQSSAVVPVILKKPQTNQKPFRKWKLKEYLFHLMVPPLIHLTYLRQVLELASAAIVLVNICFCIWVCTIPISQGCMPTISVLENTEINTGTTVLHYCIATRENDFFPLFPNDSHLPKSHNLKFM